MEKGTKMKKESPLKRLVVQIFLWSLIGLSVLIVLAIVMLIIIDLK